MGLLQNHMHAKFKTFLTASSQTPDQPTALKQAQGTGLHCIGQYFLVCFLDLNSGGESSSLTITLSNKKKGAEHKKTTFKSDKCTTFI